MSFFQEPPQLSNQYVADATLQQLLGRHLPKERRSEVEAELEAFAQRVGTEVETLCLKARAQEPELKQYDSWGRRIDEIQVSEAWTKLGRIAAEEGLVALAYERRHGPYSRTLQAAKLYLFNPSSAIYTCPLAMSDGAARLIEVHGDSELKERAFQRLVSRDPDRFWTSGQWMTERAGGSDIRGTETVAEKVGAAFALTGSKWFTSATTSQMAMTLARVAGDEELSLFYLETRARDGKLNGIEIHRLKDKMGTRAMPTAELTMRGTPAKMIGPQGRGVAQMATLFNVTRIYNAITSVGYMRRGLALAIDYAHRREAFGKPLVQHPLHARTLAVLSARVAASLQLVFHVVHLQGKQECGEATDEEEASLRLMTPAVKLFTAKEAVAVLSEVLECFGGAGYMEDNHLPVLLRDAQVLPIWEGTTNVLSLDVLRSIKKDGAFQGWHGTSQRMLERLSAELAPETHEQLQTALNRLEAHLKQSDENELQVNARSWAYSLARTHAAIQLADQAAHDARHGLSSMGRAALNLLVARDWLKIEPLHSSVVDEKRLLAR